MVTLIIITINTVSMDELFWLIKEVFCKAIGLRRSLGNLGGSFEMVDEGLISME